MEQAVRTFYLPDEENELNALLDDAHVDVLKKNIKAIKDMGIRVWVHILRHPFPNPAYLGITRRMLTFVMRRQEDRLNEFLNSPDLIEGTVNFYTVKEGSGEDFSEIDYALLDLELHRNSPLLEER